MGRLKVENYNKCVSLLREFVDESSETRNKKDIAKLALEQLVKITAGTESPTLFRACDIAEKPVVSLP
jgi:hypothetical protein